MSSGSDSESRSGSASPINTGVAPTPGHGLDRSASNSPNFGHKAQSERYSRSRSRSIDSRRSRSQASGRSRSGSAESNRTGSQRADSQQSHSGSDRSRANSAASNRSRGSATSGRSGSNASYRSGSNASKRSGSAQSNASRKSRSGSRSRSGSNVSKRSRSGSNASKRSRSGSNTSKRSRSGSNASKRSRSGSNASKRSRSGSNASNRSKSVESKRSRSGSPASKKSGSAASRRSRSRSGSRSKASSRSGSAASNRSRSGSRSKNSTPRRQSGDSRSRSNSPNLEIDEGDAEKRPKESESEDDVPKKRVKTIASDSEEEGGKEVSAAAIFGDDADDISSEEEKDKQESDKEEERKESDREQRSDDENEKIEGEDEDKENEPEPIPETRIDVKMPKISCNLGRDIHFVKLPNFLSVETRPFDPETYEDEIDEEETLDEEGRARLKLKVENTIRWREIMDDEGNFKKESNARIVKWSDGSFSLHLGSEIFDVYKQPLQGDHNHLFIRQGTGLQGQAVFRTKLSFRPHSTESFTHRKMTLSLADRSQKTSGIKILSQVGIDPDHDRANLLKKEEEKLRQTIRNSKPRRKEPKAHITGNTYHEEGSDDEGTISINAIKNKYKSGAKGAAAAIYSSDEEGSDIELKSKKTDKTKVLNISDSESE